MASVVYMTQAPASKGPDGRWRKWDYSDARRFGQVIHEILQPGNVHPEGMATACKLIGKAMEDFKEADYLLLAGDPALLAYAALAAASVLRSTGAEYLQLLKWDKITNEYVTYVVPIGD